MLLKKPTRGLASARFSARRTVFLTTELVSALRVCGGSARRRHVEHIPGTVCSSEAEAVEADDVFEMCKHHLAFLAPPPDGTVER
jgi:hypothetical protein